MGATIVYREKLAIDVEDPDRIFVDDKHLPGIHGNVVRLADGFKLRHRAQSVRSSRGDGHGWDDRSHQDRGLHGLNGGLGRTRCEDVAIG